MKYLMFLLLPMLIIPALFINDDIQLKGKIIDAGGGLPVASALIQSADGQRRTRSASDGTFTLKITDRTKSIIISAAGFQSQEVELAGEFLEIRLTRATTKAESHEQKEVEVADAMQGSAAGIVGNRSYSRLHSAPEPDFNTEDYAPITENRFLEAATTPLSTFSVDVDGASYSNVRRFLQQGQLPPAGSVRVEEMINYFHYNYPQPLGNDRFSINTEVAECPWNTQHKLVMIGLQGKKTDVQNLPASNLVLLIDVSGSMMDYNKLPLVKSSLQLLTEQLREEDRVSIVVYAGAAGLVLPPTSGSMKQRILNAVNELEAGGSTAGGEGIRLAYETAKKNFIPNGNNRVILCTDGDFNVGASSDAELEKIISNERQSGVYLTVLGYGMGNYKDNKMQILADKGNGNHSYIDNISEARKVLVNEFGGTMFTIAKDVKLQIEFNPALVQGYRLVGYENRMLNKEDFNNDAKDAGEIGSGHTVTALYEIIPAGIKSDLIEHVDPLKYQHGPGVQEYGKNEMMNIKIRYKKPDEEKSILMEHPVSPDENKNLSENFSLVAAVAQYGMLLNHSEFRQSASFASARSLAKIAASNDREGYRKEFLSLLGKAEELMK